MKITKKLKVGIVTGALAITSFGLVSFADDYFEISRNLDIFASLYREVNVYYVDEIKPGEMMKTGIDAMLKSLDPYTNYIPESEIEDYRFMTTGQYGGIGALIAKKGDYIVITDPYENYPAQKAGLLAGDMIVEIDGKVLNGKNSDDVSKYLKGQPGTPVKLMIQREGVAKPFEKSVMREEIKIPAVSYSGVIGDGTIGYIRLTSFTENCGKEVGDALVKLKTENKITSLVFDLRDNPGGLLNEAVNIVNLFEPKGTLVVNTKGKVKEWDKAYRTLNPAVDADMPVAVLINSGSASASEIVSGCMQDLDRGILIGTRSYGKGLVQTTRPLPYNAQLKVTTAKYYIPSGRCIQALDYSNRNADGSVGHVPDSLMSLFKTKEGRTVYDGGGVVPDFVIEQDTASAIVVSLVSKFLIFDYATKYRSTHPTIAPAKEFHLTDQEYLDFTTWLNGKDYDYTTRSEKLMEDLKKTAIREKEYDDAKADFDALNQKLSHNKQEDLIKNKAEIEEMLENEIVSRYYFEKGRTENEFLHDKDVKKAIEALSNKAVYTSIIQTNHSK
jgi:carboxyl-terminal processing protease